MSSRGFPLAQHALRRKKTLGGPGWLSTQGSHRPVRAGLPHTVPLVMSSLRNRWNGSHEPEVAGNGPSEE
jgi:hypothetical protein